MKLRVLNREFNLDSFRELCEEIETIMSRLTLEDNFGASIREITIGAGEEVKLSHSLKRVPKYRIILRQDNANALITDGASPWTDTAITLKNHGASSTTITVMILRG
jgi:hypothetical protein